MNALTRRHRIRNISLGLAVILVGIALPLSITKGNQIVGGNATLFGLWGAFGALMLVWFLSTDWAWARLIAAHGFTRPYLPRIVAPERRVRLRRRRYDAAHARALIAAGRMGERLSQTFDVGEPEITPKSVGWRLGPKQASPELAKAAAGHRQQAEALIRRGETLLAEVERLRKPLDPHTAKYQPEEVMSHNLARSTRYAFFGTHPTNSWLADVSRFVAEAAHDLSPDLYPESVKSFATEQAAIRQNIAVLQRIVELGL